MITIYRNWDGKAVARAPNLEQARALLNAGNCGEMVRFGDRNTCLTALDTGDAETTTAGPDGLHTLAVAQTRFARIDTLHGHVARLR